MSRGRAKAEGFRRTDRIQSRTDFLRVQREGKRVHTPHFVILVRPAASQRLGITVTRKAAPSVGRNRVRRLVREVFRRNRPLFPPACEIVLVARTGADRLDYAAVLGEVARAESAMRRAAATRAELADNGEARR